MRKMPCQSRERGKTVVRRKNKDAANKAGEYPILLAAMDSDQVRKAMAELIAKPLPVLRMLQEMVEAQQGYSYRVYHEDPALRDAAAYDQALLEGTLKIDRWRLRIESYNLLVKERFLTDAVGLQHFYGGQFGDGEVETWLAFLTELREAYSSEEGKFNQELHAAVYKRTAPNTETGRYAVEHVPQEIERMLKQGGPSEQDACDAQLFVRWSNHYGEVLANIILEGKKDRRLRDLLMPMEAKAIAYLSFAHGGVDAYGQHWEAIPYGGWQF